jgi:NADH-quinone oxidoreductase subunit N
MSEVIKPAVNLLALAPEIVLLGTAFLLLVISSFRESKSIKSVGIVSLVAFALAFVVNFLIRGEGFSTLGGMIVVDAFSVYFNAVILLAAFVTVVISFGYAEPFGIKEGEFYLLLIFSTAGMMMMGSATDLLSIFIALEIMSIPIYVLVGFRRENPRAREASYKYFILGALSSGIFVYGAALVYGGSGTTNLSLIADALSIGRIDPILMLGVAFVLSGFFFKISAVPFHMWTPDTYEGASMPITAFMSVGVKAAAFSALVRFVITDVSFSGEVWTTAVAVVAILSMIVGNAAALAQDNLKRLLAYSSIAHVGYILVAVVAATDYGVAAILFYILIYVISNLGIFALLIYFSKKNTECEKIEDLYGLGYKFPIMAVALGIFMFSLAGIPPTGGFMGKLFLFAAAVKEGYVGLVVVGVLASGVSVYYYLRVINALFQQKTPARGLLKSRLAAVVVILSAIAILYFGVLPGLFMDFVRSCAGTLF